MPENAGKIRVEAAPIVRPRYEAAAGFNKHDCARRISEMIFAIANAKRHLHTEGALQASSPKTFPGRFTAALFLSVRHARSRIIGSPHDQR